MLQYLFIILKSTTLYHNILTEKQYDNPPPPILSGTTNMLATTQNYQNQEITLQSSMPDHILSTTPPA